MEEGQRLVLLDQVRDWCGDSRTKVTIKPVIDLNTDLTTPAYDIPDRIREQVILRDRTCVFPWCTRPARGCDIDHVIEYDHDAEPRADPSRGHDDATTSRALCRFHHRLKTHTAWRYRMTAPGVFEWTSPHGHRYRRDRDGTTRTRPTRSARHSTTPPTMTPPHTPPLHRGRGHGHARLSSRLRPLQERRNRSPVAKVVRDVVVVGVGERDDRRARQRPDQHVRPLRPDDRVATGTDHEGRCPDVGRDGSRVPVVLDQPCDR